MIFYNGDIKLYSKKNAYSEPEMFKGKFRRILTYFAADEEGARYVCKKIFGKDEIAKELYKIKLGDYYLANFCQPYHLYNDYKFFTVVCFQLNFKFWYDVMVANGKESDAEILKFVIDEDFVSYETIHARGYVK